MTYKLAFTAYCYRKTTKIFFGSAVAFVPAQLIDGKVENRQRL
jgi:hypothetical protein